MAKDIKPSAEQVSLIFDETVLEYHLYQVDKPKVLLVAGVSGSGKSTLITGLLQRANLNYFPIQADDYRKAHPKIREFREKYGYDGAHKKTGNFAHRFATDLLNIAVEKRLNILYETTFGNIETANTLLEFFKQKEYEILIFALPVNIELSIERNKTRYQEKLRSENTLPRIVEPEVIERMATNYQTCIEQLQADRSLQIFAIANFLQAKEILSTVL